MSNHAAPSRKVLKSSTSADHYPSLRLPLPSAIPRGPAATHALIFQLAPPGSMRRWFPINIFSSKRIDVRRAWRYSRLAL
jgi:hypothetical protein